MSLHPGFGLFPLLDFTPRAETIPAAMGDAPTQAADSPKTLHGATSFQCPNCHRENDGEFCAACGQKRIHPDDLSLAHAWHHIVHEIFHLDGKVFGSLKLLFTRPGQLTLDFLEGRRARHVHPIRLFLVFSFAYFFFGAEDRIRGMPTIVTRAMEQNAPASAPVSPPNADPSAEESASIAIKEAAKSGRLALRMEEGYRPFYKGVVIASFLFTGVLYAGFFRGRRRFLAEHLVMALHVSCIVMLWSLPARALDASRLGDWMLLPEFVVFVIYPAVAARRVYGGSWPAIVAKVTAIAILAKAAYVAAVISILALIATFAPEGTATDTSVAPSAGKSGLASEDTPVGK